MYDNIYEEMKKLESWTIYEAIMLMVQPEHVHNEPKYHIFADEYLLPFQRAFEGRTLNALPPDYCIDKFSSSTMAAGWEDHIGYFKIKPLAFLKFIKKKDLFKIPPDLEWKEIKTKSGETKYFWTSVIPEDDLQQFSDPASAAAKNEPTEDGCLTGKEKQELGRLRTEKAKMDATVLAAIKVGQFIQEKKTEEKKIIRKDIEDFVYKIDRSIPQTRIDMIWKAIPDSLKEGPGRPKKDISSDN
jgi:integrase